MTFGKTFQRRGQGMTEYIILVGLCAILLVGAVTAFKEQIRITIVGSSGAVNNEVNVNNRAFQGLSNGDMDPQGGGGRKVGVTDPGNYTVFNDGSRDYVYEGSTPVDHDPTTHGDY